MAGEPGLTTLSPEVRYRDDDVLVVEKPAGMLSHPVVAGEAGTLADWIRAEAGEAHLVNRLDRDTSGLVLAARTARGRRILDGQLARREVRRGYLAVVHGHPTEASGRVDAPIGRDPAAPSPCQRM